MLMEGPSSHAQIDQLQRMSASIPLGPCGDFARRWTVSACGKNGWITILHILPEPTSAPVAEVLAAGFAKVSDDPSCLAVEAWCFLTVDKRSCLTSFTTTL